MNFMTLYFINGSRKSAFKNSDAIFAISECKEREK